MKKDDEIVFEDLRIPTLLGLSIEGDSAGEGLVTFGARFISTWALSEDIMNGFEGVGHRLKNNQAPDLNDNLDDLGTEDSNSAHEIFRTDLFEDKRETVDTTVADLEKGTVVETTVAVSSSISRTRTWDPRLPPKDIMRTSPEALDRYTGINVRGLKAYPEWKEISWGQWIRFSVANLFGLALQWGACGPAIWVMYFSPPVVSSPDRL
jgi:hypothetical protein